MSLRTTSRRSSQEPAATCRRGHALQLERAARSYGATVALAPLSLSVESGAVCAITGGNGAGKTTLLRLAAGLLRPTTGSRRCVGPALYLRAGDGARRAQTPAQAIRFAHRAGRGTGNGIALDSVLAEVGLAALASVPSGRLSAGERGRLSLGVALAAHPALLCLDEPTAHLDRDGCAIAAGVVWRLAALGTAVLIATHDPGMSVRADARVRLDAGRAAPS